MRKSKFPGGISGYMYTIERALTRRTEGCAVFLYSKELSENGHANIFARAVALQEVNYINPYPSGGGEIHLSQF